jgi:hypothetical protein
MLHAMTVRSSAQNPILSIPGRSAESMSIRSMLARRQRRMLPTLRSAKHPGDPPSLHSIPAHDYFGRGPPLLDHHRARPTCSTRTPRRWQSKSPKDYALLSMSQLLGGLIDYAPARGPLSFGSVPGPSEMQATCRPGPDREDVHFGHNLGLKSFAKSVSSSKAPSPVCDMLKR